MTNESQIFNPASITVEDLVNTDGTITDPVVINGPGKVEGGTVVAPVNPGTTLNKGVTILGAAITGGTSGVVNAVDATLDGDTISADVQVNDNDQLTLKDATVIDSGGDIYQDCFQQTSTIVVSGAVSISGTGELETSDCPNNDIVGASGTTNSLTISVPTVSISGAMFGDGTFPITFSAPTTATSAGYPFIINVGNNAFFNNLGTIVGTDSTIEILGNFKNFNSGTNTLTGGAYNIIGGIFQFPNANIVNNAAKLTFNGNAQIVNQNGANGLANFSNNMAKSTFDLSGGQFETAGTISNEGAFTVAANNFFTVGGTSTNYNQSGTTAVTTIDGRLTVPAGGLTNITGGTLQASGQFDGDVSVGNATGGAAATFIVADSKKLSALVTISNNYTQLATGVMDVQIGGTTVGTQYSQLSVTGSVTLGGTLNAALINKFKPVSGDQFTIINAPSGVTGTFATVKLPPNFQVVYNSTSVVLEVQ
jgi:hypothetical protein